MNNAPNPRPEDLPGKAQLLRASIIAAIGAVVILVTVYLPAEHAIDPTGVGRVIGLTEMGEIKRELAEEAARDAETHVDQSSSLINAIFGAFVGSAQAQEAWRDEVTFTLAPGATAEIKLVMEAGVTATYAWTATGGRVNFDLHAHGDGQSIDYARGRGETVGEGSIDAPFTGEHGWFWRNRDSSEITVTLQLRGDYSELKQAY